MTWIDPAPAIARRVVQLLGEAGPAEGAEGLAVFTGGNGLTPALARALIGRGLAETTVEAMPLAAD